MSHCWVCLVCLAYTVLKPPFWGISVRCLFHDKEQFVMDLYAMKMNTRSWGSCGSGSRPGQPPASQSILGWGSIWVWMLDKVLRHRRKALHDCVTEACRKKGFESSDVLCKHRYVYYANTSFWVGFTTALKDPSCSPPVHKHARCWPTSSSSSDPAVGTLNKRSTNWFSSPKRWREWMKSGILKIWPMDSMTGLTYKQFIFLFLL